MFVKKGKKVSKIIRFCLITLLSFILLSPSLSSISTNIIKSKEINDSDKIQIIDSTTDSTIDESFIKNLTFALSQIVFSEYNHEQEIPKGRFFGSKGEHKAADILAENMSKIGLHVTKEKLQPLTDVMHYPITRLLEVIDYNIMVNGKRIECFISPTWIHPKTKPKDLTIKINESRLKFKRLPTYPLVYNPKLAQETDDFVFITQDQWNNPNGSLPRIDWLNPFLHPLRFYMIFHLTSLFKIRDETKFFVNNYPNCKGYVLYDFNDNCYDMIYFDEPYKNYLPAIFINGSLGKKIWQHPNDYTMDIHLQQYYNKSVESYNVIGQINGTDPSKTIILSSLYDCWWNQGTADSAIGTAIVLAIAKYFKEHNLQPKYTLKFICFSGEECDIRGANYYEAVHKDEDIICIIDLNQVGFSQEHPPLALDIVANKISFLNDIYSIALDTNYCKRTNNKTDLSKLLMKNIPSNPYPFSSNRKECNCLSLFKDGGWILHHRNGQNFSEGDVFKYYNPSDVKLTSELVLNITKAVALNKNFFETNERVNHNHFFFNLSNYVTSLIKIGPRKARYSSVFP